MKGFVFIIAAILLNASVSFSATKKTYPKSTPCKAYKVDYCVNKGTIPKAFRSKLPSKTKFVAPVQSYPFKRGTIKIPLEEPEQNDVAPYILIPAGSTSVPFCYMLAGQFKCIMLSRFNECPHVFTFTDQDSGGTFTCDVDCDNRRPNGDADDNGNCDCDVDYGSCRAGGN